MNPEEAGMGTQYSVSDECQCPLKYISKAWGSELEGYQGQIHRPSLDDWSNNNFHRPSTQWRCGEKWGFPRRKLRSYGWVLAFFGEILDRSLPQLLTGLWITVIQSQSQNTQVRLDLAALKLQLPDAHPVTRHTNHRDNRYLYYTQAI